MSEDVPDYWSRPFTRPKTMRYGFRCEACLTVDAVEKEDLEVAGVDLLRLEHKCIRCGALMLITVNTGSHYELKIEQIAPPVVRP